MAIDDIRKDGGAAVAEARRRGGEIQEAADRRVAPPVARLAAADGAVDAAERAVEVALAPVLDEVHPGGVGTHTDSDVRQPPLPMQVLESRLSLVSHLAVTAAQRTAWVTELQVLPSGLEEALRPLQVAKAAEQVARTAQRDAARAVSVGLARLKRDLQDMGLTETQIHKMIPERPPSSRRRSGGGDGSDCGGGTL